MSVQTIQVARRDSPHNRREYAARPPADVDLIRGPALIVGEDGEPLVAIGQVAAERVRRLGQLLSGPMPWQGGVAGAQEARLAGFQPRFIAWGVSPPQPLRRRYGCSVCSFDRDLPVVAAALRDAVAEGWERTAAIAPTIAAAHVALVDREINEDWLLPEAPFTSGVVNDTAALPYHCDAGNLAGSRSIMVMMRRNLEGGHLHMPEYGIWLACDDGDAILFNGQADLHAVTPFEFRSRTAYRYSVVAYAKAAIRRCGPAAEEGERAALAASKANTRKIGAHPTAATNEPDDARLDDLLTFARIEIASRDVEPWADLLALLCADEDLETAHWIVKGYNAFDGLGAAFGFVSRWPSPEAWAGASDRASVVEFPCTQERRGLRGGRVGLHYDSYIETLAGRTQDEWLRSPLSGIPEDDFGRLTAHMRQVWGVGRQTAFEWAEFAEKVLKVPVVAADAQLWESEGPRRSLQQLYGNQTPDQGWLNDRANECRSFLEAGGVPLSWEDFETIICDFNVMRHGRYYPGRHLAALREEIDDAPPEWQSRLQACWDRMVPEPWGRIKPGIQKRLLTVYRDEGRIVDDPEA